MADVAEEQHHLRLGAEPELRARARAVVAAAIELRVERVRHAAPRRARLEPVEVALDGVRHHQVAVGVAQHPARERVVERALLVRHQVVAHEHHARAAPAQRPDRRGERRPEERHPPLEDHRARREALELRRGAAPASTGRSSRAAPRPGTRGRSAAGSSWLVPGNRKRRVLARERDAEHLGVRLERLAEQRRGTARARRATGRAARRSAMRMHARRTAPRGTGHRARPAQRAPRALELERHDLAAVLLERRGDAVLAVEAGEEQEVAAAARARASCRRSRPPCAPSWYSLSTCSVEMPGSSCFLCSHASCSSSPKSSMSPSSSAFFISSVWRLSSSQRAHRASRCPRGRSPSGAR